MSNSKNDEREERLLQASRRGELESVLRSIKTRSDGTKIDVNCKGKSKANSGWTPLLLASYFGHKDVAEVLIKTGADITARNGMGNTALHLASFTGRTEVVLLLLQNNANVTDINGEGKTPSQVANKEEVKQQIVAAEQSMKLDLEKQLLAAVADGNSTELKRLVALPNPPDISCKDTIGNTPLHCAAYRGHKEIAVMLLQHGADTSIKNNSGQMPLQLARDVKMKKLLDVQPLQVKRELNGSVRKRSFIKKKSIHKVVTRHEGMLLRKSRFFGWKKCWVVLERGILSYYNKRADAGSGHKRQGFKYLDHAKFSVPKEEKYKIKIEYSDNTQHIFSIGQHEAAPQVQRQRWLNSLREHCAYSTHYTTCPTLLYDEHDENFVPVGDVQESFKDAKAHQQALDRQVSAATSLIGSFSDVTGSKSKASMNLLQIKTKLDEIVTSSKDMCSVMSHCLDLLVQQEEGRKLHMEEEVEKRRVLEDALHVLATEHHALECSIGINERIHGSKISLLSDNDEFFDAVSDLALACSDDFKSDSDDDDGDIYIPIESNAEPNFAEPSIRINRARQSLTTNPQHSSSSTELTHSNSDTILTRSSSDNTLQGSSDLKVESVHKSKSESKDIAKLCASASSVAIRRHRNRLPATMLSRNEFSVWTALKHCIGKDLSRITMPVIFNEPLTFLQRIAEYMEYVQLLQIAAKCEDPIQRLQYVVAFAVSATSSNLERVGKPFNPLLGETYELVREDLGFKLIAEQVCHHPPISALQCDGEDFVFHVTVQPKLKFWGKGVEIQPKGMVTLKFPKLNEVYTWNNVNSCVHNIIVGQMWIEQYGQIEVSSLCNGARAVVNFKPSGWFGKELNKVEGTIYSSSEKRKKYVIKGDWTDRLLCYRAETALARKGSKRGKLNKSDRDESLMADSLSTSSSDCSLELNSPALLWTYNQRPPHSREMYNFTNYAIQLNELHPGEEKSLPSTDSKLRPDCRALENGDLELATDEKVRLEEKQRAARRERQKKNGEWKPLWFKEEINPYTGQHDWLFTGKYWDRQFSPCPDIF